jgi:hypothetical protein
MTIVEGDLTIMADGRALVTRAATELDLPSERLLTDIILNLLANDRGGGSGFWFGRPYQQCARRSQPAVELGARIPRPVLVAVDAELSRVIYAIARSWLMLAASVSSLYGLRRIGNSRWSLGMNCLLL